MRNLKRVLTMIMAIAMTMSLMVVGAGAAFPDQDKVVNTEAVNMNVALGIIKGRDNGAFDPTGNVTRGEMAKMITIALNGGKDIPTGTQLAPTFSDIKGHWAEGYIEYCNTFGIVAGMGDGTFAPDASVTATQAAKMLLVALGYDAKHENFNGVNWSVTINGRASQKQLYKGLAVDIQAPLNRDNAAQMIWNALQAIEVEYYYSTGIVNGQFTNVQVLRDKELKSDAKATMLFMKYDASERIGEMTGFTYNSTKKEYKYDIAYGTGAGAGVATFTSKVDYTHLFGLNTKVVYKSGKTGEVFGMFAEDSAVLYTGLVGDIEDDGAGAVKFDGKSYKLGNGRTSGTNIANAKGIPTTILNTADANGTTIGDADGNATANTDATPAHYKVSVIDSNGDGKVNKAVVTPCNVAEVTFVGTKNINFKLVTNNNTVSTLNVEDIDLEAGVKKGDYVIITNAKQTAMDTTKVEKLDEVAGTLKATKANKVQVDGNWYTVVAPLSVGDFNLNDKYTVYTVGSYAFFKSEGENKTMADVAFVAAAGEGTLKTKEAKLYFADGTTLPVTVDDFTNAAGTAMKWDTALNGGAGAETALTIEDMAGKMVTYSKDGGDYDLKLVGSYSPTNNYASGSTDVKYNLLGNDAMASHATGSITKATSSKSAQIMVNATPYSIAENAVVFVQFASGKVKVVTGANAKTFDGIPAGNVTRIDALHKAKNGVATAQAAVVLTSGITELPDNVGKTGNYAVVLGNSSTTREDSTTYQQYTIWNGTKEVTVREKGLTARAEGTVIKYTDLGDDKIGTVIVLASETTGVAAGNAKAAGYFALTGQSDSAYNLLAAKTPGMVDGITNDGATTHAASATFYVTKDTVVIFVDSKNDVGSTEGSASLATERIDSASKNVWYETNVFAYDKDGTSADNELELLVVEISNKWNGLA